MGLKQTKHANRPTKSLIAENLTIHVTRHRTHPNTKRSGAETQETASVRLKSEPKHAKNQQNVKQKLLLDQIEPQTGETRTSTKNTTRPQKPYRKRGRTTSPRPPAWTATSSGRLRPPPPQPPRATVTATAPPRPPPRRPRARGGTAPARRTTCAAGSAPAPPPPAPSSQPRRGGSSARGAGPGRWTPPPPPTASTGPAPPPGPLPPRPPWQPPPPLPRNPNPRKRAPGSCGAYPVGEETSHEGRVRFGER